MGIGSPISKPTNNSVMMLNSQYWYRMTVFRHSVNVYINYIIRTDSFLEAPPVSSRLWRSRLCLYFVWGSSHERYFFFEHESFPKSRYNFFWFGTAISLAYLLSESRSVPEELRHRVLTKLSSTDDEYVFWRSLVMFCPSPQSRKAFLLRGNQFLKTRPRRLQSRGIV